MNFRSWLELWKLDSIKISTPFLEAEWSPQDADRDAAWDLYVEMLTRIVTQPLDPEGGEEAAALESLRSLFPTTREILKARGRTASQFARIAIPVLNQVVRPFAEKWHRLQQEGAFEDAKQCAKFRKALEGRQELLRNYCQALADLAGVENLAGMERV